MVKNVSLEVGERIRKLREKKHISQSEVSKRLNISRPVFNRIESGTRSLRDDELIKISDLFGVTTDYLLGRPVDLGDTPVAAHMLDDLTDEQKQEISEYIEFKKAKYKHNHQK